MTHFTESIIEQAALDWLKDLGYTVVFGGEIAPGEPAAAYLRQGHAAQEQRITRKSCCWAGCAPRSNVSIPVCRLKRSKTPSAKSRAPASPSLVATTAPFTKCCQMASKSNIAPTMGASRGTKSGWWISKTSQTTTGWRSTSSRSSTLASALPSNPYNRRPDVVIFVNGLPLAVVELKNAADENATIWSAFNQLQTYKEQIPALFVYNEALLISDGVSARLGTLTSDRERFNPWKTVEGEQVAPATAVQLEVLLRGVFEKRRLLDLIRYFTVFEDDGVGQPVKKMAGYHQFHAVNVAVEETVRALKENQGRLADERGRYMARKQSDAKPGDQRIGVIWHTQGSGKSLTMAFYAGRLVLHPDMQNPTIVVITDRNDLDDQLFGTFSRCKDLLRQSPVQAESRDDLAEMLRKSASGGIIFTTIQKFLADGGAYPNAATSS